MMANRIHHPRGLRMPADFPVGEPLPAHALQWTYLCDKCGYPILRNYQSRVTDGNGTFHMACRSGHLPLHFSDSVAALSAFKSAEAEKKRRNVI